MKNLLDINKFNKKLMKKKEILLKFKSKKVYLKKFKQLIMI